MPYKLRNVFNPLAAECLIIDISLNDILITTENILKPIKILLKGIKPNNFKIGDKIYPGQVIGKESHPNSIVMELN